MRNTNNKSAQGQSFLDMILQQTGSLEIAISMAVLNDRCLTDDVGIGEEFKTPQVADQAMVEFFSPFNRRPATAWKNNPVIDGSGDGISFWTVNDDFIITALPASLNG